MATHETYRPVPAQNGYPAQDYPYGHGHAYPSPIPQQTGQMMPYHPPETQNASLTAPQRQAYNDNQVYQQNQAAFEPIYQAKPTRRPRTPDPETLSPPDPRRDHSEPPPQQREKIQSTGGPLAGAASGALLGANVGGRSGHSTLGTIGGMVAGAFAGTKLEKTYKERRQERMDLKEAAAEDNREDPRQKKQDEYDKRYTDIAYAAPGYGTSLLPADTSHGGSLRRNSRTS